MKKRLKYFSVVFVLLLSLYSFSQSTVYVGNGALLYVSDSSTVIVKGSIVCSGEQTKINNEGTVVVTSSNDLSSRSDFLNNASSSAIQGKGKFIFNARTAQVIGGLNKTNFHNLEINNSSFSGRNIVLNSDISVGDAITNTGKLTLISGIISSTEFTNHTITVNNNNRDAIEEGDEFSYVSAKLERKIKNSGDTLEYRFPIGNNNNSSYANIIIDFEKTSDVGIKSIIVEAKEFGDFDTLTLVGITESGALDDPEFYDKIHNLTYVDIKSDVPFNPNVKYDLYFGIGSFKELRSNRYGMLSRKDEGEPWKARGEIDQEGSIYRNGTSKFARRTNLNALYQFALAGLSDFYNAVKIKKLFSTDEKKTGLVIDGIESFTTPVKVFIYNRHGSLIYKNEDYKSASHEDRFRGFATVGLMLNKNEVVANGTYYYVLETQDQVFKSGYLHLQFFNE